MEVYHASTLGDLDLKGLKTGWGWSKAQLAQPLLATASGGNAVNIYTSQGSPWAPVKGAIRNVRGTATACLAWHPLQPLLAIGWQDGAISVWDAAHRHLEEDSKVHRQPISHLLWTDTGSHLLTADTQGKVAIWEIDKHQQPQAQGSTVEKGSTITHVIWGTQSAGQEGQATVTAYYAVSTPDSSTVTIKWLNAQAQSGVVQDVGESLLSLLYYRERQQLVAVTNSGSAVILGSRDTGARQTAVEWDVVMKVKFAGTAGAAKLQICWAGPHTLATATDKDGTLRLLQLDTDDNYILDLSRSDFPKADSESGSKASVITGVAAVAYEPRQQSLAAATPEGRVCVFKRKHSSNHDDAGAEPAKQWEPQQNFQVGRGVTALCWGPTAQLLGVQSTDGLHICTRAPLLHKLCEGFAAIQEAADRVLVEKLEGAPTPPGRLTTPLKLAGLDVTANMLLLHDGSRAQVYKINGSDSSLSLQSDFESPAVASVEDNSGLTDSKGVTLTTGGAVGCAMALYNDSVYRTADRRVEVCNLSGVVKQTLMIDDTHGQPILLHTQNEYLAVLTSKAQVRTFRLAGREVKPQAGPGPLLPATFVGSLQIASLSMNCNGSMVCATATLPASGCQEPRLFVYSAELNTSLVFDFAKDSRAPRAAHWDMKDPRLLAVQMMPLTRAPSTEIGDRLSSSSNNSHEDTKAAGAAAAVPSRGLELAIMFATADAGLLLQEYQDLHVGGAGFLGVAAPYLLIHRKTLVTAPGLPPRHSNVTKITLQVFSGMEDADEATRQALLDFNYHLAVGKLEDAFRAVAALKSPTVWRNMAHMAIKNKRLDVAEHCLGNMEHVRGSRALREGSNIPQLDARVGLVAVQLGLPEDAARLFAGCERWDLLEHLHHATGNWDAAFDVAGKKDRIHLQSVSYGHARHLEAIGDYKGAIQHYIDSGTAATEVPRMLWQQGELPGLEHHVMQSADPGLLTWWARYCESQSNYDKALSCYQRAGNQLAMLRIYCATGNWQAAEDVVSATQDAAAAFHLARLYEAQNKVEDALRCYSVSKRYSHGARLAKRCGMEQELLSLALKSPPNVMLEAADYLLESGNADAAALLYQKGGHLAKALEMALSSGLYDVLDSIAEAIDQDANPGLMARCAEAFISAGHHAKAVQLLVRARQPERALDLLLNHDVPLTDELAEALTPEKKPDNADSRSAVLMRIAQAAKRQGLYHLACKKYTQAGDRLKAMRALTKSGDTEKITFFAGVSKQREVYIMAANYLQTLDWRANPDYLKNILNFYTKAGAADNLAGFYMGCAQMEIDEYKAYDKALQALQEAAKHMSRSRASDRETKIRVLDEHGDRIRRFNAAQDMLAADPAGAVTICQQLLQDTPEQQSNIPDVRLGDVYGLLVEWCYQQGNMPQAMQLLQQMADRGLAPQVYLSDAIVTEVCQANGAAALGHPPPPQQQQRPGDEIADDVDLPEIQDEEDYAGR